MKPVLEWRQKKLVYGLNVAKSLILVRRTVSVVGEMRSSTVCTFWGSFSLFGQFLCE